MAFNYLFGYVPNDEEGEEFIKNLKKFLNKDGYKMVLKGQHLDQSKLPPGKNWRHFTRGQPRKYSKYTRIYFTRR
tara:strand:- start:2367 stop:2591 length:225 start_codon:yes stop_codon:yes gene_type:complete